MTTTAKPASVARLERALKAIPTFAAAKQIADRGELTIELPLANLIAAMTELRDHPDLRFDALIDVTCVDYLEYPHHNGARFAAVYHLLSVANNHRLRVRVDLDDSLTVPSVMPVWQCADWMEREAYDMFGVNFAGHHDLRRILTDYGFEGHPLQKDFPLSGNLEVHYDAEQEKVVYGPVEIEERENVHRVFREPGFASDETLSPPAPVPPVAKKD